MVQSPPVLSRSPPKSTISPLDYSNPAIIQTSSVPRDDESLDNNAEGLKSPVLNAPPSPPKSPPKLQVDIPLLSLPQPTVDYEKDDVDIATSMDESQEAEEEEEEDAPINLGMLRCGDRSTVASCKSSHELTGRIATSRLPRVLYFVVFVELLTQYR